MAEIEALSKQKWRAIPLVRGILHAAIYCIAMVVNDLLVHGQLRDYWPQFALLLVAAGLLFTEVIDGATLVRAKTSAWSKDGLMYAFHIGCAFAVPLIIALWIPEEPVWRNPVIFGVSGVIFGLLMTHWFNAEKAVYLPGGVAAIKPFYRETSAAVGDGFGRKLYLVWPVLCLGFMALQFSQDRQPGYGQLQALLMMVLFTTLYAPRDPARLARSPRLPGVLVFFVAIFMIYRTSFL